MKGLKKPLALLLTSFLAVSLGTSGAKSLAFASGKGVYVVPANGAPVPDAPLDAPVVKTPLDDAFIVKNVVAPSHATFDETFVFSFEQQDGTGTSATDDATAITDKTINVTNANKTTTDDGVTAVYTNKLPMSEFITVSDEGIITAPEFPHAGEYVYKVTETNTPITDWTLSKAEYTLRIYVENELVVDEAQAVPTGRLVCGGVTVEKNVTDDGTDVDPAEKVDPSSDEETDISFDPADFTGFTFQNIYVPTSDLSIQKEVEGLYGDTTKKFAFENLTIIAPLSYAKEGDEVTAKIIDAEGAETAVTPVFTAATDSENAKWVIAEYELSDGEQIFISSLPVGATYSYTESANDAYTPVAVSHTTYDDVSDVTTDGVVSEALEVAYNKDDNPAAVVGQETGNTSVVTNTRDDIIPTGIVIRILPFAIIACLAGLSLFVFIKSRKKDRKTL